MRCLDSSTLAVAASRATWAWFTSSSCADSWSFSASSWSWMWAASARLSSIGVADPWAGRTATRVATAATINEAERRTRARGMT